MGDRFRPRLAWIVPTVEAGGVGPVALETTSAMAVSGRCEATLVETHAAPWSDRTREGLRRVALDMGESRASASVVLDWLRDNPQHVLFTNGVSHLNGIFPYIPRDALHVAVLHDASRRYRDDVMSYAAYLDGVVAVSDYVHDWARKDLHTIGFSGIVRRIHNGTNYPAAPSRASAAGPLRLLFVGNMWLKGGSRLAAIAKALRRHGVDFHLTVIGEDAAQVERQLDKAGLQERVTWHRRLRREELWRTYAAHDVLLMLSWGESFGMVTIEAMGMGCVPVAYDVPSGSREIIEPGISGILAHPNSRAIATALAGLSPARLLKMSAEASRRARTHFSAERAAQKYLELIDDLMRSKDIAGGSRLGATTTTRGVESPVRSPIARIYHALPSSWRNRIRKGLGAYPIGAAWLRERL